MASEHFNQRVDLQSEPCLYLLLTLQVLSTNNQVSRNDLFGSVGLDDRLSWLPGAFDLDFGSKPLSVRRRIRKHQRCLLQI